MPYYRGDGNYYRGDPFLGALLGAAVSGVGKLFKKKVTSKVGGAIGSAIGKVTPILRDVALPLGGGALIGGGAGLAIEKFGPSAVSAATSMFGARKKYRRMNPLNPRALRRALRRAEGFEKFARRTVNGLRGGPRKFKKKIPRS